MHRFRTLCRGDAGVQCVVPFVDMALSDIFRGELASLFPVFLLTPIQIPYMDYLFYLHKLSFFLSEAYRPLKPACILMVQGGAVKGFVRPYTGISFASCPLQESRSLVGFPSSAVLGQGTTQLDYGASL